MKLYRGRMRGQAPFSTLIPVAFFLLAVFFILALVSGYARAAGNCMSWPEMKSVLAEVFGETAIGGGIVNRDLILQVFVSLDGDTFTIVAVNKKGVACAIHSGSGWEPGRLPSSQETEG